MQASPPLRILLCFKIFSKGTLMCFLYQEEGNVGLKKVAKLMINAGALIPRSNDHTQFFKYLMGTYEHCCMNIINNNMDVASIPDLDQ